MAKVEPYTEHWGREGFYGDGINVLRAQHVPDFLRVSGPHAPHRFNIADVNLADRADAGALPTPVMLSRTGAQLCVSVRERPMPFVIANVEADEVHFIQQGEVRFATAYGNITGGAGDFVFIPRAVPYRIETERGPTLSLIVETPGATKFAAAPQFEPQIESAVIESRPAQSVETTVLLKSFDGVTRYVKPYDPFAMVSVSGGNNPVWKINLKNIPVNEAGHPRQFAASPNNDELFYTLSARRRRRPPMHYNADYDEMIFYFTGPGAYGAVKEPGTLTWVPKGVPHHG
ncbi:MAG: homogentisate 1,2-dioxygenase, partial [Deltaproteobacteria bacterium]|nr:homogentisate 1,2-dioxygenase [Deltaproteobacteria bacterium]